MRYAARTDTVQQAIVEGLRKAGYRVEIISRPVDLLVGKQQFIHWNSGLLEELPKFRWRPMECKTPGEGETARKKNNRQIQQQTFIRETGTPVITSLEEALKALEDL